MQTLVVDTLRVWREAERVLQSLSPADPDHEKVRQLVIQLRSMYASLSEARDITAEDLGQHRAQIDDARLMLMSLGAKIP